MNELMSIEEAMKKAIASTEMEGFVITDEQKDLMERVLKREIGLKEAVEMLNVERTNEDD